MFFQDDFRVGGHFGLQFAARILDRYADFERGDVILLHTHRRDLCDLAIKRFVFERLDFDARSLAQIHLADVALVDFALHVYLAGVAQRHDQRCRRSQYQNRAHRITHFNIAREHDAIDRGDDIGVAELFFELLQIRLILRHHRLRLRNLCLQHGDLGLGDVLLVQRQFVGALRILQSRSRNHAILRHADVALVSPLQQRHIRTFRVHLGPLEVSLGALQIGFRRFQCRARLLHLRLDFDLVELGQQLALLHAVAIIDVQPLHDAACLRLHFNLGDGRDLAGRHNTLGQVAFFDFGEFRRINLGATAGRREYTHCDYQDDDRHDTAPDNQSAALLFHISAVAVHSSSCTNRQVEMGSHRALAPMYVVGIAFVPDFKLTILRIVDFELLRACDCSPPAT